MAHLTYSESKRKAVVIISILGAITIFEVVFALLGKGHISESISFPIIITAAVMIILSLVKAYLIVYEFMHMKYEVPGMVKSVLLPMLLLVWAIVAFFSEGNYCKSNRAKSKEHAKYKLEKAAQGSLLYDLETKEI